MLKNLKHKLLCLLGSHKNHYFTVTFPHQVHLYRVCEHCESHQVRDRSVGTWLNAPAPVSKVEGQRCRHHVWKVTHRYVLGSPRLRHCVVCGLEQLAHYDDFEESAPPSYWCTISDKLHTELAEKWV